jgi:hypothetical protein
VWIDVQVIFSEALRHLQLENEYFKQGTEYNGILNTANPPFMVSLGTR